MAGDQVSNTLLSLVHREAVVALASIAALMTEQQQMTVAAEQCNSPTPATAPITAAAVTTVVAAVSPDCLPKPDLCSQTGSNPAEETRPVAQKPVTQPPVSDSAPATAANSAAAAGATCIKQFVRVWDEDVEVHTGPGGGKYYINSCGTKSYVRSYQTIYSKEAPVHDQIAAEPATDASATDKPSSTESINSLMPVIAATVATSSPTDTPTVAAASSSPVVSFVTSSVDPLMRQYVVVRNQKRNVHTGPRGGQYYLTSGGNKAYIGSTGKKVYTEQIGCLPPAEAAILQNQIDGKAVVAPAAANSEEDCVNGSGEPYVKVGSEQRRVYVGARGGLYYYTRNGNKAYVGNRRVYYI